VADHVIPSTQYPKQYYDNQNMADERIEDTYRKNRESYKRLDTSKEEIRLLKIPSTQAEEDSISSQLITTSLTLEFPEPQFFALSYGWGESMTKMNIIVNGQDISVTINLANALANIRGTILPLFEAKGTNNIYIWADALCLYVSR
jgi:Heterokaryon incompatibility protein (HET)